MIFFTGWIWKFCACLIFMKYNQFYMSKKQGEIYFIIWLFNIRYLPDIEQYLNGFELFTSQEVS